MAENLAITAKMFRLHYDKRDSENVNSSNHKNPISFYLYIRNCFETEKRLLGWSPESGENFIYDNHLARTTTRINRIITEIKVSIIEHETAALVNMQANTSQLLELESLTLIFDQLEKIMFEVIETHLAKWKEEQRLSANGLRKKSAINIGLIRIWSQEFVSIVCHVHEKAKLLQSLQPAGQNSIVDQYLLKFFKKINTTLVYLITSTVIFVYQPLQTFRNRRSLCYFKHSIYFPQILNYICCVFTTYLTRNQFSFSYYISRFVTQLEFLVGCKHVQMDAARPGNVILVSEDTALLTQQNNAVPENAACCEMENEVGVLVEKDDNRLLVDFSNIMIKKFKRAPRQGIWSAAEEKYAILFQSQFEFVSKKEEGLELKIQAWTMSLPIVPIVFGNQEKIADATILWDNAFAKNTRVPFEVRDSVSWLELIDAINMKFTSETYRSLTQLNIQFLAEKLNITSDDQFVSWLMFLRTNLPNRSFSFWEWFYAAFKLTSHHLHKIWVENYIIGFIKKDLAESYLMPWPEGTFLLRFSNSEIGEFSLLDLKEIVKFNFLNRSIFRWNIDSMAHSR